MKKPLQQGQILPEAILIQEMYKSVGDMKPGAYGWTAVWADKDNHAFVFADAAIRDSQGEFWPHLVIASEAGFSARLMTQRVQKLDTDVTRSAAVIPVLSVEL